MIFGDGEDCMVSMKQIAVLIFKLNIQPLLESVSGVNT